MNKSSDSFDRRRFVKSEIGTILKSTGLTNTFAQTNYGPTPKKVTPKGDSGNPPVIRL